MVSEANQYHNSLTTSDDGKLNVQRLSYGLYTFTIGQPASRSVSESVDIHSSLPIEVADQVEGGRR